MSMPETLIAALIVQLSVSPPSNVATSDAPGAVASLDPPDVVDQLVSEVKLPPEEPIQYLVAASAVLVKERRRNEASIIV